MRLVQVVNVTKQAWWRSQGAKFSPLLLSNNVTSVCHNNTREKLVSTENFSFVVKDIRITHLVLTRSKKISHSCLVPIRSRSLYGGIFELIIREIGGIFTGHNSRLARTRSALVPIIPLSRFSPFSSSRLSPLSPALALLACSVIKPHESPWRRQIPLTFSKLSPIDVRDNSSSIWSIYDVNSLSSPLDCMFPWTPRSKFIQWPGSYASNE